MKLYFWFYSYFVLVDDHYFCNSFDILRDVFSMNYNLYFGKYIKIC